MYFGAFAEAEAPAFGLAAPLVSDVVALMLGQGGQRVDPPALATPLNVSIPYRAAARARRLLSGRVGTCMHLNGSSASAAGRRREGQRGLLRREPPPRRHERGRGPPFRTRDPLALLLLLLLSLGVGVGGRSGGGGAGGRAGVSGGPRGGDGRRSFRRCLGLSCSSSSSRRSGSSGSSSGGRQRGEEPRLLDPAALGGAGGEPRGRDGFLLSVFGFFF